jgi:hypothetical protein
MTPWVMRLLVANVLLFFVAAPGSGLYRALLLYPPWALFRPWTVFTYMFLHANTMHLLFNMIGLFFFGPRLEAKLGSGGFLKLYFLSGLGGAALSFIFAPQAAVVGASAAVFGVLIGFAHYWPRENICDHEPVQRDLGGKLCGGALRSPGRAAVRVRLPAPEGPPGRCRQGGMAEEGGPAFGRRIRTGGIATLGVDPT